MEKLRENARRPADRRGRNFLAMVLCVAVMALLLIGTLRLVVGVVSAVILG
jgi:uncharacterized protein YqhQ